MSLLTDETDLAIASVSSDDHSVVLADGSVCSLASLSRQELLALQWEQERAFARRILAAKKGSTQRSEAIGQAYDTVPQIFAAIHGFGGAAPVMGVHSRHIRLVLDLLRRQQKCGIEPRLFEIGFGAAKLLQAVRDAGIPFAGIEMSRTLRQKAVESLGHEHEENLHVGDFLQDGPWARNAPWSLIYWNDVWEHIPPDEIGDWLQRIHRLLPPGGQLVTITPNWHMRPFDATALAYPPRTEAQGLHLKEYTLREVRKMLYAAGFANVATPLAVLPERFVLCGSGLTGLKCLLEPVSEWMPYAAARLFCRGFALSCTIATKG
jgi:SAM-dependent methyltransferase